MVNDSLANALKALVVERDRIEKAIASIEEVLNTAPPRAATAPNAGAPGARGRGHPAGRPVGGPAKPAKKPRGKRKNAPRGLLKVKIHQALKASKQPLKAARLRDAVVQLGYPSKNLKSLYTAIFAATRDDPKVKKTAAGYSLKS